MVEEGSRVSKFTTGEWEATAISAGFADNGNVIGAFEIVFPTKELSVPEMKANAHLIEVAPSHHEALGKILTLIAEVPLDKNVLQIIALAEQALAKVGGKN